MFICQKCNKDFKSQDALNAHMGIHNNSYGERLKKLKLGRIKKQKRIVAEYNKNPNKCKQCGSKLSYEEKNKTFCNNSCSAIFSNKNRGDEWKVKSSISHKGQIPWNVGKKYKADSTNNILSGEKHPLYKRIEWCCPVCNKTLQLRPFDANKRKYCSGTCRNKVNNLKLTGSRSKAELLLEKRLNNEFINWNILYNDRETLGGLELDVYIPEIKTAIEWNGIYHFKAIHSEKQLENYKKKDKKKRSLCKKLGINLIIIADKTSHESFIKSEIDKIIQSLKSFY